MRDPIHDDAARHILEVIMKRQRYGWDVMEKIAAHIEKTAADAERNRIRKEAKLLLHRTKQANKE